MTVMNGYHSDGPEMPGLGAAYMTQAFAHSEASLLAALNELYVRSEDDRENSLSKVSEMLSACNFLGIIAGVDVPTKSMTEAEEALGVESEVTY